MDKKVIFNKYGEPVVQIKKDGGMTIKGGTLKFNEDVSLGETVMNLESRMATLECEITTLTGLLRGDIN